MKWLFLWIVLVLSFFQSNAQLTYGKMGRKLDSFSMNGSVYRSGGKMFAARFKDSVRIKRIEERNVGGHLAIFAVVQGGFYLPLDSNALDIVNHISITRDAGKPIAFSDVISAKDSLLEIDKLYSIVLEWFGKSFVSAKSVIEIQDRTAGTILAKGRDSYLFQGIVTKEQVFLTFSIDVHLKRGRLKLDIYNIRIDDVNFSVDNALTNREEHPGFQGLGSKYIQRIWVDAQLEANLFHTLVVESLTQAINKGQSDW